MNNETNYNKIHSLQEAHAKEEETMPKIKMSDAEKIERWNIANMFEQIDPYILSIICNDIVSINDMTSSPVCEFVDHCDINHGALLGFETCNTPIKIEPLREIAELVRERLYGPMGEQ